MKFLICGLGNIGSDYSSTRHNVGFMVLDKLIKKHSRKDGDAFFVSSRYADKAEVKFKGRTLVLIKPSTYMNLSGKAVSYWLEKEKIPIERSLTIVDELALPFGKLRLKGSGGDAGHNGLKNIAELIGTKEYPRVRFGIGADFPKGHQADFVLSPFSEEEQKDLDKHIDKAISIIESFASIGLERTMNFFN